MNNKEILADKPEGAVSIDFDGDFFNLNGIMWDPGCNDFDYHDRPVYPVRSISDIEEIEMLRAENERLTDRFKMSTQCINDIDDLFEYAFRSLDADRLQDKVHNILAAYTESLAKQSRSE